MPRQAGSENDMTARTLHPDWPPFDPAADRWDHEGPAGELAYALDPDEAKFATATAPAQPCGGFQLESVAQVVRYRVWSHSEEWKPGDGRIGSELEMYLVLRLTDGRWVSVEASNDYTGWGCQSGADFRIGDTEQQVVQFGLSQSGRVALGYEQAAA